jgi:hypothetical protein
LLFGTALGLASVVLWPKDLGVYLNIPGTAAGDWVYRFSIEAFGNPHSDQAHYSIPWMMRVPQIHAVVSPILYLLPGIAVQWVYNRVRRVEQRNEGLMARTGDWRRGKRPPPEGRRKSG